MDGVIYGRNHRLFKSCFNCMRCVLRVYSSTCIYPKKINIKIIQTFLQKSYSCYIVAAKTRTLDLFHRNTRGPYLGPHVCGTKDIMFVAFITTMFINKLLNGQVVHNL